MGTPLSEWRTLFRDFVAATPFALLVPLDDAHVNGAMLGEPEIEVEVEIVHSEPANWTGGHLSGHST
jgi:hypothetical protein